MKRKLKKLFKLLRTPKELWKKIKLYTDYCICIFFDIYTSFTVVLFGIL